MIRSGNAVVAIFLGCALGCPQVSNVPKTAEPVDAAQNKDGEKEGKVELTVRAVVAERFKVKPQSIDMKKPLSEAPLKGDELDLVQVVMTLEERFLVEIPDSIIVKHGRETRRKDLQAFSISTGQNS